MVILMGLYNLENYLNIIWYNIMDSLDIANKILQLYQQNVDKSSGSINKNNLQLNLYIKNGDKLQLVTNIEYINNVGIIIG